MRRNLIIAALVILLLLAAGGAFVFRFNLSAIPEPGSTEIAAATRAKHFLIGHASRDGIPGEASPSKQDVAEGDKLYGAECAMCHGLDGERSTDTGRWMYPRAANLRSPAVQSYSNRELFWILKNGDGRAYLEPGPLLKNAQLNAWFGKCRRRATRTSVVAGAVRPCSHCLCCYACERSLML
jgi:Cytochrome C oxidase, cbb3-type, subunit III